MGKRGEVVRIMTLTGIEKRCTKCGEFWPEDKEFFFYHHSDNCYYAECRACYYERKLIYRQNQKAKSMAVSLRS